MRQAIVVAALSVLASATANAADYTGQCVYPRERSTPNGNIEFMAPTYIFNEPKTGSSKQLLTSFSSFKVKAEKNGYIQLSTVPDYSKQNPDEGAGEIVGWATPANFRSIELRNCN